MSELQNARLKFTMLSAVNMGVEEVAILEASIKNQLVKYFWAWYRVHAQDKIVKVKILFFSVTVRVATVKPLFVLLFGAEV